jgi:hypothetical protein
MSIPSVKSTKKPAFVFLLLIATIMILVFSRISNYGFLNWDDNVYIYNNKNFKPVTHYCPK